MGQRKSLSRGTHRGLQLSPGREFVCAHALEIRRSVHFQGVGRMGLLPTIVAKGFPLRIDWTLVDEQLPYSGQYLDDVTFSDHRPLITTFFSAPTEPRED